MMCKSIRDWHLYEQARKINVIKTGVTLIKINVIKTGVTLIKMYQLVSNGILYFQSDEAVCNMNTCKLISVLYYI